MNWHLRIRLVSAAAVLHCIGFAAATADTSPFHMSRLLQIERGSERVIEVSNSPTAHDGSFFFYERPTYCVTRASLVEGIVYTWGSRHSGSTGVSVDTYNAVYVYLLPCERDPDWTGPIEPTAGRAQCRTSFPFVVGESPWSLNMTITGYVYAGYPGPASGRISVEDAGGRIWFDYQIPVAADEVVVQRSVELPEGSYVLRTHVECSASVMPYGWDAASVRARTTALLPPVEECSPFCAGDANGDRVVDFRDVTKILENWAVSCP